MLRRLFCPLAPTPILQARGGLSALILAAQRGDVEVADALLRAGANPDLRVDDLDARRWAVSEGHPEVAAILEARARLDKE